MTKPIRLSIPTIANWKSLAILCLCILPAMAGGAEKTPPMRTWISADGKFHVVAKLAEVQAEAVVLEKEDGSRITVPRVEARAPGILNYVDRARPAPTTPKETEEPAATNPETGSPTIVEPIPKDPPGPDTAPAKTDEQSTEDDSQQPEGVAPAAPGTAAGIDGKDTRLTLKDIEQLHQKHITPEQIVDDVAEQGRAFAVTAEVAAELRSMGFRPAQIDAIKESSPEPLVPGKWLTTIDAGREAIFAQMGLIAVKSGAAIQPIGSQHVTLWAAKEIQQTYLSDVKRLEKYFHTKCAEPIRSGLDKRSTHVILLKDHAEYETWCRAVFDLMGKQFEEKDNPGAYEEAKSRVLKESVFNTWQFCAISTGHAEVVMVDFIQRSSATRTCSTCSGRAMIRRRSTGKVRTRGRNIAR